MKKNLFNFFILLFLSGQTLAQNWVWSEKVNEHRTLTNFGLMTDNGSNVYSYRALNVENPSGTFNFAADTMGSYLFAYSPSGTLLFSKHWNMPFYIRSMQFDGSSHFYFSGEFFGALVISGIPIISNGGLDGVTGKMDLNGNIVWMQTFGGSGHDFGYGVSHNSNDNTVFSTGSIKDTLYLNNTLTTPALQNSAIVLHYSSTGTHLNHKTYDFIPQRDDFFENKGVEIVNDPAGNTFLMMDRDGYYWNGTDSVPPAPMGRYVFRLNAALDTVWSQFIIGPGCYWGWTGHSLRASATGDLYVLRHCAGHHGGSAEMLRLNGSSGSITYSLMEADGYYNDVYVDSTTVYLMGTEDVYICLCPADDPGHRVVKIIDESNMLLGETRVTANAYVNHITKDGGNSIYFNGDFNSRSIWLGPDELVADSTDEGTFFSYWGQFLSRLSTTTCNPPTVSAPTEPVNGYPYIICPTDSVTLSVDLSQGSFIWSNGDTGTQTTVDEAGNYTVVNTQPNGCVAYSLPLPVDVNLNNSSHRICAVGFNSTFNGNRIVVRTDNSQETYDVNQVNLFKDVSGTITLIQSSTTAGSFTSGLMLFDSTSNPNTGSVDYYISTVDTCGTESALSQMHRTMYLDVDVDSMGRNVLNWNHYVGDTYTQYLIYKGTSSGSVFVYDSVSITTNTYTDNAAPSNSFYQIEAVRNPSCFISGNFYGNSFSNVRNKNMTVGINEPASGTSFSLSPNPAQDAVNVHVKGEQRSFSIVLRNILGQVIYSENIPRFSGEYRKQLDISGQPKGIYFMEVLLDDQKITRKIVKQ